MKRAISVALAAALALVPLGGGSTAFAAPLSTSDVEDYALQMLAESYEQQNTTPVNDESSNGTTTDGTASPTADDPVSAGGWTLDPDVTKGNETLEESGDWVHFKSGAGNGNSASNSSQYPAVAINDGSFDFSTEGGIRATIMSPQDCTLNRFGFYLGYDGPGNGLFIGYDLYSKWYYQLYVNGEGDYKASSFAIPEQDAEVPVAIDWDGTTATLTVGGEKVFDVNYSSLTNLSDKVAMKASTYGTEYTDVYVKDFTKVEAVKYAVNGTVVDAEGQPIEGAKVRVDGASATTDASGAYTIGDLKAGKYTISVGKDGYEDVTKDIEIINGDLTVDAITLNEAAAVETETLSTKQMKVEVKKNFPSVLQYTMTKLDNRVMYGQSKDVRTVEINNTYVELTDDDVTFSKESDTKAVYTMNVKNAEKNIDAVITAEIVVEANTLDLNITKIENKLGDEEHPVPVQTVSFPNQSLISMREDQDGAQFTGAVMSSDTNKTGDEHFDITTATNLTNRDYMYAFISGNSLSAGMWSNSENEGRYVASPVYGGAQNTRIYATTQTVGGTNSLGLASAPWYYHRTVTDSKGVSYTVEETEMPKMSVVITGDENDDDTVDWQDGAIAFRSIMNNPYKSEEVPELVAWRIAMNFGSQAQNPFLTTLDNVKKVALNTDGLGQSVLLKGYGNEGHDSGHPDYGDIGERMGGAEDMNTLMEKGAEYGARFGVHVNASEMYPEAEAFSDDSVRRNSSGGLSYGWNWLDQGVGIDGIWDLATGARENRFAELKEKVGDNMDFIYLDVWGNLTSSGSEDSWETRKMSKMINDNGWRMTTEWGPGNEYDSTFQHWAADLTYGDSTSKGENSQVMRFLRNHQKDSWVGDYPSYGGAANAPLLGGYNMKDFEGWQGRNDYDAYITNLYTHDVSTKFIQHFKVSRWVNNPLDDTSSYDPETNGGNEFIELKDDEGNVVTLARETNDQSSTAYRNRTITFNGQVVATGAVSKGDGTGTGTESYLLPWLWDAQTGEFVNSDDEKLYHWNTAGGTTEWTLPDEWQNLANVKVYKLTDLGKTDEQTVSVVDGKVTLTAEGETPYVVYKGDATPKQISVTWSEGMHLVDAGFNGGEQTFEEDWTLKGTGEASIAKSQYSNPMLKLTGKISATQKLTDLTPGERYALYVGVDNRSDGDATMTVTSGGETLATNSTSRSIAKNYVKADTHNTNSATVDGTSYFQNMYVFFTAPENGEATLTLAHQGEGDAYFDNVRVVANAYDGLEFDESGDVTKLTNDFENNAQGIWPFVISGSEGVEDNRIHLSEKHAPYTQAGWDVKKMDDVLDGDWSVKVNGLTQKGTLVYQTVPQNFEFEPGRTYKISFDYQVGSDDSYAVAVGSGEFSDSSTTLKNLKKSLGKTSHYEFELTGSVNGDSWFGIYSTSTAPDLQGLDEKDSAANFGGYKDIVLDNLVIERVDSESKTKAEAENKLAEVTKKYDDQSAKFSDEAWTTYQETLAKAKVLINKSDATAEDYTAAFALLEALDTYMPNAPGNDSSDKFDVATNAYTVLVGSEQSLSGNEGPADLAQDGLDSTHWHTKWGYDALGNNAAWYQFNLSEATTITGLRYLPRSGAANANGKIKKYKIELTTTDGTTRAVTGTSTNGNVTTVEGEFSTSTEWQLASFDAVENVTSVKFIALETAGQTAGEMNKYASAAELRLTTTRDVPPTVVVPDTTDLTAAVTEAEGLRESDYTADSWKTMSEKLAAAKAVLDDENADVYSVLLATTELNAALEALEPVAPPVDKTDLQSAVDKAKALVEADYTAETWAAFATALSDAQAVLDNAAATQSDVDAALTALQTAMQALKPATTEPEQVNKAVLQAAVDSAKALVEADYTAETWAAFATALSDAQAVLDNAAATQSDVDAALTALQTAMQALKPATTEPEPGTVNKSALQAAIAKAEALDLKGYTEASAKAVREALASAKLTAANATATQEQVDAALKALEAAIAGLEKAPASTNKPISSTGASVFAIVLAAMVMAAAGLVLTVRRRSRG
ncbi:serine protease [Bifidobacterium lemurum]|uniref:Serine protease n=1 Tax=Bifidobacterium lemurum TaxID=1603886 RepID=A0A261FSZ4_9BIFI|nr:endo-alpha-N-acetylgalactosaminidase family protein [Bifidobacterium lemurum]OZG62320.1 serine protease [Bifidobacterium lemurum]